MAGQVYHVRRRRHALLLTAAAAAGTLIAGGLACSETQPKRDIKRDIGLPRPFGPVPDAAHYVSPEGRDSDPGTRKRPWRTLKKALAAVRPGDTVVFRPGTFGMRAATNLLSRGGTASAPVTFRGEPGRPMPRVLGFMQIAASHVRFHGLLFDGPTGSVKESSPDNPRGEQVEVGVYAEKPVRDIEISGCEIRDSHWHAGIFLSTANDVRITGNYIHDNGDFTDPGQANLSHGIYWDSGSGLVANNVIEHNVARGVQLYPDASGVAVLHNTIVRNGRSGVQLGDGASDNIVANNVIAFNGGSGIRSDDLSGAGNLATGNLLWGNAEGNVGPLDPGFEVSDNRVARPHFVGRLWRLAPRSPGVDDAQPQESVSRDRLGVRRPEGRGADVGAYEVG
jgi:hypothetical protein